MSEVYGCYMDIQVTDNECKQTLKDGNAAMKREMGIIFSLTEGKTEFELCELPNSPKVCSRSRDLTAA